MPFSAFCFLWRRMKKMARARSRRNATPPTTPPTMAPTGVLLLDLFEEASTVEVEFAVEEVGQTTEGPTGMIFSSVVGLDCQRVNSFCSLLT